MTASAPPTEIGRFTTVRPPYLLALAVGSPRLEELETLPFGMSPDAPEAIALSRAHQRGQLYRSNVVVEDFQDGDETPSYLMLLHLCRASTNTSAVSAGSVLSYEAVERDLRGREMGLALGGELSELDPEFLRAFLWTYLLMGARVQAYNTGEWPDSTERYMPQVVVESLDVLETVPALREVVEGAVELADISLPALRAAVEGGADTSDYDLWWQLGFEAEVLTEDDKPQPRRPRPQVRVLSLGDLLFGGDLLGMLTGGPNPDGHGLPMGGMVVLELQIVTIGGPDDEPWPEDERTG